MKYTLSRLVLDAYHKISPDLNITPLKTENITFACPNLIIFVEVHKVVMLILEICFDHWQIQRARSIFCKKMIFNLRVSMWIFCSTLFKLFEIFSISFFESWRICDVIIIPGLPDSNKSVMLSMRNRTVKRIIFFVNIKLAI